MKRQKPACEYCGLMVGHSVRPRDMDSHVKQLDHELAVKFHDMRERGYRRCRGTHAVINSAVGGLVIRAPICVTRDDATANQGFWEGFWAPAWAVSIAARTDVKIEVRKRWLHKLYCDPDNAAAFMSHVHLGGNVLEYMKPARKDFDRANCARVSFYPDHAELRSRGMDIP